MVIESREGSLFIAIGDVVGHGIGAALLMATARANLRALCSLESDLEAVTDGLNRFLERDMDEEKFMTMFVGHLDYDSHRLEFSNAGHDNPVHYSARHGTTTDLESTGLPLGIFPEFPYGKGAVALEPGEAQELGE